MINDTFRVQWFAINLGTRSTLLFRGQLIIYQIPDGCPGSDDQGCMAAYDCTIDRSPGDFVERSIEAGAVGPLMAKAVAPFVVSSYHLTVILDIAGLNSVIAFNYIEIIKNQVEGF